MKIGLRMPYNGDMAAPENLLYFANSAEKLGYYSLFMSDHIAIPMRTKSNYPYNAAGFDEPNDALELMTTLAFIAARTSEIRLMSGITVVPYRNPLVTAKMLATIDHLSKGRLIVGAGAGWMKEEFDALGVSFSDRGELVDEYIRIYREVWTRKEPQFNGKYIRFSPITVEPKPCQKDLPIWIGGESPRAIRRAAELGDGWLPIGSNLNYPLRNPDQLSAAIAMLKKYTRKAGRDVRDLNVGYLVPKYELRDDKPDADVSFVGNPEKIVKDIKSFADIGVSFLGFEILGSHEHALRSINRFASEVMPSIDTN